MANKNHAPKLPVQQLAILAVARFAEPLAYTSVFPYLPEMIASFGIEKKEIAKWAGITSSMFSLAQSLTAVAWGRASDRFGRKPTIMMGLICTMTCFLIWGMSTSLPMAIAVRALMGAGNGNVGIIRTMVAEMVTERELQPKAFSVMPLVWSVGSVFGPAFGGLFAKPADQWPGVFGNSTFFKKFPFLFPNLIGSLFFLLSLSTAALFLNETLQSKRHTRDWGLVLGDRIKQAFGERPHKHAQRLRRYSAEHDDLTTPLLNGDTTSKTARVTVVERRVERTKPLPMSAVFSRQTTINLIAYTFLALHAVAYDQALPVFLNYPVQKHTAENTSFPFFFSGGFGLNHAYIGAIFAGEGIVSGFVQFMLFPVLCKRFGVLSCFKFCTALLPFVYLITPFVVLIEHMQTRYAALCIILIMKNFACIVGFPCTTILLTNSATSLSILGTLNGFATTFSALGRAMGPALTGSVFTWGVKHDVIGAPYWVLALISAIGAIPSFMVVDGDGPSGASTPVDSDDEDDTEVDDEIVIDDEDDVLRSSETSTIVVTEQPQPQENAIPNGGAKTSKPNGYGNIDTGKASPRA
ncbi:hypothetical protein M426DRAFT_324088 [Hypoxylon sp. CI-4A]|nr:hypothetical protein M426DRAFT_324088 [Hypoxylon sp. CI-4A]